MRLGYWVVFIVVGDYVILFVGVLDVELIIVLFLVIWIVF